MLHLIKEAIRFVDFGATIASANEFAVTELSASVWAGRWYYFQQPL